MRHRTIARLLATLALAAAFAAACASTELSSVWRSEAYRGGALRSLLVMGLSDHPGARAVYEERMVRGLAAHGVRAVPSMQVLPEHGDLSQARLRGWVRELGIEGVLTTHLVRVRREIEVVTPSRPPTLYGYYDLWWSHLDEPWVRETETVELETNLYDADGRLVWSALSETFAPASRDVVAREVVERVVAALAAEGLIPAAAPDADPADPDAAYPSRGSGRVAAAARGSRTVKVVPSPSLDST